MLGLYSEVLGLNLGLYSEFLGLDLGLIIYGLVHRGISRPSAICNILPHFGS